MRVPPQSRLYRRQQPPNPEAQVPDTTPLRAEHSGAVKQVPLSPVEEVHSSFGKLTIEKRLKYSILNLQVYDFKCRDLSSFSFLFLLNAERLVLFGLEDIAMYIIISRIGIIIIILHFIINGTKDLNKYLSRLSADLVKGLFESFLKPLYEVEGLS